MAFIVRPYKHTAGFYRRRQIPLGGGAYKYDNTPLGNLPYTTTEIPADFPVGHPPLTEDEKSKMEEKFFAPARAILEALRKEEQEQRLSPAPRLVQALALLSEAAALSHERPVEKEALQELLGVLTSVRCADKLFLLAAATGVVRAAADAANAGTFGARGNEPLRETAVAPMWQALNAAITGTDATSLMRALQRCKFVKSV